jgi:1,4-alpha-glucan branching enzyme
MTPNNREPPWKESAMVRANDRWVEFLFFRPQAQQVELIGDFNQWRPGDLPMHRTAGGFWRASVQLPPGEFRFRYLADGQGFPDYAAFGLQPGPYGLDSVVHVNPA